MKRKTIIYVSIVIIIIAAYYFLSVFFTKNGQFIHYYFSYSNSKKESVEKEIFITDKLDVIVFKDSGNIAKKNFDIWLDRNIITKQYGFLPIRFSSENNKFNSINILPKEEADDIIKENISYKVNNEEYSETEMRTLDIKKGEQIKVDFYFNKKLVSVIEIKTPLGNVSN